MWANTILHIATQQPSPAALRKVSLCRRSWCTDPDIAPQITQILLDAAAKSPSLLSAVALAQHTLDLQQPPGKPHSIHTAHVHNLKQTNPAPPDKPKLKKPSYRRVEIRTRQPRLTGNVPNKTASDPSMPLPGKSLKRTNNSNSLSTKRSTSHFTGHRHTLACYDQLQAQQAPQPHSPPQAQGDGPH